MEKNLSNNVPSYLKNLLKVSYPRPTIDNWGYKYI